MTASGITLCAIFRIPTAGHSAFQAYEDAVLPLLDDHGGRLLRRLRTDSGGVEIHLIWFPSASHLDGYRADPRRCALADLFDAANAQAEVLSVVDVETLSQVRMSSHL